MNIELCTEIVKYDEPDSYGLDYPIIHFKGCNAKWYYGDGAKASEWRDKQYNEIMEIFGNAPRILNG